MIPSDHFVRFYNEVFRYLDGLGGSELEKYWLEISRHQELHCLDLFRGKGLKGMYEYWEHIRIEENADMTLALHDDHLHIAMNGCPSLAKVMDNDAGAFIKYCDHCPGWVAPLMQKCGFYYIKDIGAPDEPVCRAWIYEDKRKAEAKKRELVAQGVNIRTAF